MLFHKRTTRRWLWLLSALLMTAACGDDDGGGGSESDGGLSCNPVLGGVGTCRCITGTLGVRYCSSASETWGACMCNEPQQQEPCVAGQNISCACPDGTLSFQVCRAANTRDPCMCTSHMIMDSGTDDASDMDSGAFDAAFDASDNDAT